MALDILSRRESETMAYMILGLSTEEMMKRMCISEQSVKNHKTGIYKKLKVSNATQVVSGWFLKKHDFKMTRRVPSILRDLLKEELGAAWNGCDFLPFATVGAAKQAGIAEHLQDLEKYNYWGICETVRN